MIKDIGATYHSITVLSIHTKATNSCSAKVWGKCKCGTVKTYWVSNLRKGHTKSCGCLKSELLGHPVVYHKKTYKKEFSRTYNIWAKMKARCYRETDERYPLYGARGITICPQWRYDFDQFVADMGTSPEKMSIERIDNDGNYEPGNCKWVNHEAQCNNRRSTVRVELNGESMGVTKACRLLGVSKHPFTSRYKKVYSLNKDMAQKCFEETCLRSMAGNSEHRQVDWQQVGQLMG
jgi:hypothetical protein